MPENGFPHALLILSSNTLEGVDRSAFNSWYNQIHVPDLLTIEEIECARRYRLTGVRMLPGVIQEPQFEYVAIYKLKANSEADLESIVRKIHELGAKGLSAGPFDFSRTSASLVLSVSDTLEADPGYVPSYVQPRP